MNSKAEVCDLGDVVLHKNVGYFQIPMDDVLGAKIAQTIKDICYNCPDLSLF